MRKKNQHSAYILNKVSTDLYTESSLFRFDLDSGETYILELIGENSFDNFLMEVLPVISQEGLCKSCSESECKSCGNASFESSTFEEWEVFSGDFWKPAAKRIYPVGVNGNNIFQTDGFDPFGGKDLPVNNPFHGKFSARLGDSFTGAKAQVMRYQFVVDRTTSLFTYYYAVVFQETEHYPEDQPYFKVFVTNEDGDTIDCATYEVFASSGIDGFKESKVSLSTYYKPWSSVAIPLGDYLGQKLTVNFVAKDCAHGGHFGYAYLDAFCNSSPSTFYLPACGIDMQIEAPEGFKHYLWDDLSTNRTLTVNMPGAYSVDVEAYSGCIGTYNYKVVLGSENQSNVSYNRINCNSSQVQLNGYYPPKNHPTYGWRISDSLYLPGDTVIMSVKYDSTYQVKYVIENDMCSSEQSLQFTLSKPLTITNSLRNNYLLCQGDSLLLDPGYYDGASYLWNTNEYTQKIWVKEQGKYSVDISRDFCSETITTNVEVYTRPLVDLGKSEIGLCPYEERAIGIPSVSGYKYLWNTGDTTFSITVSEKGKYNLQVKNGPCVVNDTVDVVLLTAHTLNLDFQHTVCNGDSVKLSPNNHKDATFIWNTGDITPDIWAKSQGKYTVISSLNGCNDTAITNVVVYPRPAVDLGKPDTSFCINEEKIVGVQPTAGYKYMWNTHDTTSFIHIPQPGKYTLTVTNDTCSSNDSVSVQVLPVHNLSLNSNYEICYGDSLHLSPEYHKDADFAWNTGDSSLDLWVGKQGEYIVISSLKGCMDTATTFVKVHALPVFDLGNADTSFCMNENKIIGVTPTSGYTYRWNTHDSTPSIEAHKSGIYKLEVTNNTCAAYDEIKVQLLPVHYITLLSEYKICKGDSVKLVPEFHQSANYIWSTGDVSTEIWAKEQGEYTVVSSLGRCRDTTETNLKVQALPVVTFGDSIIEFCEPDYKIIGIDPVAGDEYLWDNYATTSQIEINQEGTYRLLVKSGRCEVEKEGEVRIWETPYLPLLDSAFCPYDTMFIDVSCLNCKYKWAFGSQSGKHYILPHHWDEVTVTNEYHCTKTRRYIALEKDDCLQLYIPNSFTPNDDENNNTFYPVAHELELLDLWIYDRWGEEIFHTNTAPFEWDGTSNGNNCKQDVYVFVLKFMNSYGHFDVITGSVTLVR